MSALHTSSSGGTDGPEAIIQSLGLAPHPEGGWYRQTWEAHCSKGERPPGTAIYFLLTNTQHNAWHRVDAGELWLYHSGAPLVLNIAETQEGPAVPHTLGGNVLEGQSPQILVPENYWQSAATTGDWTLVTCVVSPGFRFSGFTVASPSFEIPGQCQAPKPSFKDM